MRPLELRLRNFRSYFGAEAVFDLRNRGLLGVVGPIGSGKSSLLDAVALALYGRTPAGGEATTALIHQRADNGAVQLRFEVDGEIWEVVRSLRRKGQSQHALYRYPEDRPDVEPVEKITQDRPVNDKIRELLGLDFDAFGRSVLLAQGRFAEFLTARPADRDRVLKGVFGYERIDHMRQHARDRSQALAADLAGIDGQLRYIDGLHERLGTKVADLEQLEQRRELLTKAESTVADLDTAIAAARQQAEQVRTRLDTLKPLGGNIPQPTAVAALVAAAAAAAARRTRLAGEMELADSAKGEAEAALAALEGDGERELLDRAGRRCTELTQQERALATAAAELAELDGQIETEERRRTATVAALDDAQVSHRTAERAFAAADETLSKAREEKHIATHRNMAATLRGQLTAGDDCPVCLRVIEVVPVAAVPGELAGAEAAVAAAVTSRETSQRAVGLAAKQMATLEAQLAALDERRAHLDATRRRREEELATRRGEVGQSQADLAALVGAGDPEEIIAQRRDRLVAQERAADAARRRFDDSRREHAEAIAAEQEVTRRSGEVRIGLARVAGALAWETDTEGDTSGATTLSQEVERVRDAWLAQTAAARADAERADTDLAAATTERSELMQGLGVDGGFIEALARAQASCERLTADIVADRAEIDGAASLAAERAAITAGKSHLDRIAHDLTDGKFVRYLLDEERARLADLGSDHFMRLTSGRYRFTEDGDFAIVDLTAADAVRKASSLSGGETFLASLALALALAEMVTRTGSRLDAFFLDEGFGSLDPEHLDLAMDGIEALVADGSSRLVIVVSHVPELRHRIEDLIQLDRDPATGDTRIIRG